ncbi:MAG: 50S ribosomal protein L13 [Methanomassiliicoccales archaeon]
MAVINAEGHVLGRLCSNIAERLLNGEEIVVVNAEKAVIVGKKEMVFAQYKQKRERGKNLRGPYYPRRSDLILKRVVRGMIPYNKPSGKEAYRRLKVYVGIPEEFASVPMEKIDEAVKQITGKFVTLSEVSGYLGSNVR